MGAELITAGQHPDLASLCFAITEHALLPMATVEGSTHILRYGNPAFCRLMDQPMEQLVGKPLSELLPKKDQCVTLLDRVFRTGKPESHTEQEDARPHPVFWSYTMWPVLADEALVGVMIQVTETAQAHGMTLAMNEALMLGSVRQHELTEAAESLNEQLRAEIDERNRAEEALRASEERFRVLFDLGPVAVFSCNLEGVIQDYNRRAAELWGRELMRGDPEERFCGSLKLYLPDGRLLPHAESPIVQVLETGVVVRNEEVFIERPDGSRIAVAVTFAPLKDEQGAITGAIAAFYDLTERRAAEQALRKSEEQFASIFNQTTGGIAETDLSGHFVLVNDRFCQLMGRSREEVLKLRMQDITHPEDMPASVEKFDALVEGRITSFVIEKRYLRPDGSVLWAQSDVAGIRDAEGRVRSITAAVTDITERRELEDSLLVRASDLVRADRSKDEFLAMLAHELRNPLAPLRNAAEILRTESASAEASAQAQRILNRQIENMSRMIDDLLDISRITEGKIELRKQVVALETILAAAANLARPGMEAREQEFRLTLPTKPVFLNADATRLEQVFGNLLSNACKYSDSRCCISLSAEVATPAGFYSSSSASSESGDREKPEEGEGRGRPGASPGDPEVIVRVRDNGIGIAPEMLGRIFDLFVQATRALDRASGGLGIGLTLVQRLVKLHGGSVEARSDGLGHGSEFIVRLPIFPGAAAAPPPPAALPARETRRRMLIVDDNEDSARSMSMLQRLRGHETRIAFTGHEAVATAAEFAPEVVLLDIGLPGMDGFEVARQLRVMPGLTGLFLVAMTGYGSEQHRFRAKEAGFDEYMVKPVDLDLLRAWLRSRP